MHHPERVSNPCDVCREEKKRLNKEPPCIKCGKTDLLPENRIIISIVNRYYKVLVDGTGGINPDGIRFVLELEQIKDVELITHKLLVYLGEALDTQNKEHTNGGKNN